MDTPATRCYLALLLGARGPMIQSGSPAEVPAHNVSDPTTRSNIDGMLMTYPLWTISSRTLRSDQPDPLTVVMVLDAEAGAIVNEISSPHPTEMLLVLDLPFSWSPDGEYLRIETYQLEQRHRKMGYQTAEFSSADGKLKSLGSRHVVAR